MIITNIPLKTTECIVRNAHGMHWKPCALLSQITSRTTKPIFFSTDKFERRDIRNSMLNIFTLELTKGTKVKVETPLDYPEQILNIVKTCLTANSDYEIKKLANNIKKSILIAQKNSVI